MKTPKLNLTKVLLFTSASKLAVSPSMVSAGGKDEDVPNPTPPLTLNQAAKPIDVFVPLLNDENMTSEGSMFADDMAKYEDSGMLFVGEIPESGAHLNFIINNVRNDQPVDVFVAMSQQQIPPTLSPPVLSGKICIDMGAMEVLGGVRIQPSEEVLSNSNSSLGKTRPPHFNSAIITVHLPKEKIMALQGKDIYFQAGAFPVETGVVFDQAQISECDHYVVSSTDTGTGGKDDPTGTETGGTNSSCPDDGGKNQ